MIASRGPNDQKRRRKHPELSKKHALISVYRINQINDPPLLRLRPTFWLLSEEELKATERMSHHVKYEWRFAELEIKYQKGPRLTHSNLGDTKLNCHRQPLSQSY